MLFGVQLAADQFRKTRQMKWKGERDVLFRTRSTGPEKARPLPPVEISIWPSVFELIGRQAGPPKSIIASAMHCDTILSDAYIHLA